MLEEKQILELPKRNNYHYNIENVDGDDCMILYHKVSDYKWNRHVEYCKEKGIEDKFKQWLMVLIDVSNFMAIKGYSLGLNFDHLQKQQQSFSIHYM